ncbi:hypothetical protein RA2_03735 [Roseovarius sp. A-2]|uniref:hypothetical protein n=1 Tax=Roseovarius sp. A-2 TaxID=1570360 RepID=UPI0009B59604|nr:hypothetical protein [Roseovarius sp. A-2]GAW36660.1 hypothetical protein RA2_03735 [Roseovarius sp. A-2]
MCSPKSLRRLASEHINEQVFNGWMQDNAFDSISKGYKQMLSSLDLSELSDAAIKEIEGILALEKGQLIEEELDRISAQLESKADIIKARKEAMASVPSRIDHMAGAGASHEHKGTAEAAEASEPVTNLNDMADLISSRAREAYDRIQAEKETKTKRPTIQTPNKNAQDTMSELGLPVEGYDNVKSMPGNALMLMVTKENGASPEQIRLMNLVRQGGGMGGLDNIKVFVGPVEELNRLKETEYKYLGDDKIEEGQTFVGSQVMFLTNFSPETVLHESLHASTFKATVDYFDNPEAAPQPVREAVQRLEALEAEFLKIKPDTQRDNIRKAMETLRADLSNPNMSPAQKISEFISWSLSNQNLIELGQATRVRNPLVQVVSGVLKMLRKMLGLKTSPGKNLFENVRFNAEILGAFSGKELTARRQSVETDQVLNQKYPGSERLKTIESRFLSRLNSYLEASRPEASNTKGRAQFDKEVETRRQQARTASETAIANGYDLNPRQGQAYEAMHLALMSGMRLDPSLMRQATQAYPLGCL